MTCPTERAKDSVRETEMDVGDRRGRFVKLKDERKLGLSDGALNDKRVSDARVGEISTRRFKIPLESNCETRISAIRGECTDELGRSTIVRREREGGRKSRKETKNSDIMVQSTNKDIGWGKQETEQG